MTPQEIPTRPLTWRDIDERALFCPILYNMRTVAAQTGDSEQAILWALLWFSRERERMLAAEVERRSNEPQAEVVGQFEPSE